MTSVAFTDIVAHPLLPAEHDRDTAGFFAAARRGELVLRFCTACDQVLHLPRQACFACGGNESEWRPVPGRGHLYAWTVVTHQVHPAFAVPYTVVVVDVDGQPDGTRLVGRLAGEPVLTAGQPMRVRFDRAEDGTVVPNWEPGD
ncbi:Zn-ribbon domain-containing OB-fold protein [Prauserella flavalba]|uniref:DNA-binding protein n=1 Tax=Prauserella flavalba TaxID=1477506 RepID=A0A318M0Z8_9PSEU|nr:OB-fold domain-containing protein [Prauserella flavalba]PXY36205.1 hypothetical protein BA062_12270 [Prauserella flavalba]